MERAFDVTEIPPGKMVKIVAYKLKSGQLCGEINFNDLVLCKERVRYNHVDR